MSRKNKYLRAFLHQTQSPTIEQAWDAAWKHAQKTFHARSMQDMEEQLTAAQAENEALRHGMRRVNANAKKHEREMYLAKDEVEALRGKVEELETMVKVFRGCVETGVFPESLSPCHHKIIELVGGRDGCGGS